MKYIITIFLLFLAVSSTRAETLSFTDILKQAINNSYDLKVATVDVGISEAGIKEARAEYFPAINLGYNAGYDRDLSGGGSTITPVGDSVMLNSTRYQSSASAGLQYNLFDFGARGKKLKIAKKDKDQKQTRYSISMRDLKLQLADTYTETLLNYKEYITNKELLGLNNELFIMQERLFESGKAPKSELIDQALAVARITSKIDDIAKKYQKSLEDLSFYTGREYNIDNLELLYLEPPGVEPVRLEKNELDVSNIVKNQSPKLEIEAVKTDFLDIENLPEYKYYQLEIEKKEAELSILNRQRLPQFKFFTNYYLYGDHRGDYWRTLGELEHTILSFRISSTLPVFTGFKNTAQREKAKLEIEKLKLQRDKKLEQLKSYYQKMYQESRDYDTVLCNQERSLELVKEKIAVLERLNEQKLIDKLSYIKQKTDLTGQKLEFEKVKINNNANEYKLYVLKMPEDELCKQD